MKLTGNLPVAIIAATLSSMGFAGTSQAEALRINGQSTRIVTCATPTQAAELLIHDEATANGALIENASLITLPNGMKAVTFSARYAPRLYASEKTLMVRYTVAWTDACGRSVSLGSNHTDGFALNPRQTSQAQATAFSKDASLAVLRVYVENPDQIFTSPTLP